MSTLATPAIYNPLTGVIVPDIKPPYQPAKVVVVYMDSSEKEYPAPPKGNGKAVLAALEKIKGILPPDIDGVAYEDAIRKEAEQHFQNLNW